MRATAKILAVLLLVAVLYVLSYAPVYRVWFGHESSSLRLERRIPGYQPVVWLTEESPLREPLLAWADLWGVRGEMELDTTLRYVLGN